MTTKLSDTLIRLSTITSSSPLRRVCAEAVLQALSVRCIILNIKALADETELTLRQVETALDDLAIAGCVELTAEHGLLRVRRTYAERRAA